MFKEKVRQFAQEKVITTILIKENDLERRRDREKHCRWDFYLASGEREIPVSIHYQARISLDTGSKTIYHQHIAVFPSFEVLSFIREFDSFMLPFLERDLKEKDTEKLRRITEGKPAKDSVAHSGFRLLKTGLTDRPEEEYREDALQEFADEFVFPFLTREESTSGYEKKVLMVYGKKGGQLAAELKKRKMADIFRVDENTHVIRPFFPYLSDEKNMSDMILSGEYMFNLLKKYDLASVKMGEADFSKIF